MHSIYIHIFILGLFPYLPRCYILFISMHCYCPEISSIHFYLFSSSIFLILPFAASLHFLIFEFSNFLLLPFNFVFCISPFTFTVITFFTMIPLYSVSLCMCLFSIFLPFLSFFFMLAKGIVYSLHTSIKIQSTKLPAVFCLISVKTLKRSILDCIMCLNTTPEG